MPLKVKSPPAHHNQYRCRRLSPIETARQTVAAHIFGCTHGSVIRIVHVVKVVIGPQTSDARIDIGETHYRKRGEITWRKGRAESQGTQIQAGADLVAVVWKSVEAVAAGQNKRR